MKIQEIRTIAKNKGVKTTKMGKTEIIRAVQKAEGNTECYGTGMADKCEQIGCLWREDCLI